MSNLPTALDAEWDRIASSARARRALVRWGNAHRPLRGLQDLHELLERRREPRRSGPLLRALAVLARDDELAARTLLQALLPGIVRLASGASGYDDWGAADEMVALAWERIRRYPTGRPGSVAANVLLDVRKAYRRHRRLDAPRAQALPTSPVLPPADDDQVCSTEEEVVERICFAQRLGQLHAEVGDRNLRLVWRTRVNGESPADVAAEENLSVHAFYVRRRRTEQHLARQTPHKTSTLRAAG